MDRDLTIREAKALGKKLFAEKVNIFEQGGIVYVGRFLDDGRRPDGGEAAPHWRAQEIFGTGRTFREAFQFYLGADRVYSYAGAPCAPAAARAPRPVVDKYGRIRGWTLPSGVFSRHFPGMRTAVV